MDEFDVAAVSGQTYTKFGNRGLGEGSWGKGEIDPKKPFDVDDLSIALIKLKSGRTILLEASWAEHGEDDGFNGTRLFGTDAGLQLPPLKLFRSTPKGNVVEHLIPNTNLVNPNRMVHFIDCLLGKAKPYVLPAESLAVQKILDAIYKSAATGREVRIR
jgi:predicted dehydrogenase